jgi:hypothetical protein
MNKPVTPPKGDRTQDIAERDIYKILSNNRRRVTIQVLKERMPPIHIESLSDLVSNREGELSSDNPPADHEEQVRNALYHAILPMLRDHGVIEWDPESGMIETTGAFEVVAAYLNIDHRVLPPRVNRNGGKRTQARP